MNFGLKLWSNNTNYYQDIMALYEKDLFKYIELFIVPETIKDYLIFWQKLSIPVIIHATHEKFGLNLALKENRKQNKRLANEVFQFADALNAKMIIFHPGCNGEIDEVVYQLNDIFDNRIVIENLPYFSLDKKEICQAYSPVDIKYIMDETNIGFCLDFGHAIYAANANKTHYLDYLNQFIYLNPQIAHISDGDIDGVIDVHYNFGDGNFDFIKLSSLFKNIPYITIETKKNFKDNLSDFEKDVDFLRKI